MKSNGQRAFPFSSKWAVHAPSSGLFLGVIRFRCGVLMDDMGVELLMEVVVAAEGLRASLERELLLVATGSATTLIGVVKVVVVAESEEDESFMSCLEEG